MKTGGSDDELLQSEDSEHWERLLEKVRPASMLLRIEQRLGPALRARVAAQDIWQETLLRAWQARQSYQWRGPRKFRAWLMQIAENRILDLVESLGTQKRDHRREVALAPPDTCPGPEPVSSVRTPSSMAAATELAALMREALEALPEGYREVLRLRLLEEWTRHEIADHLGLSIPAVKHRLRLGAARYRERLAFLRSSRGLGEEGFGKP